MTIKKLLEQDNLIGKKISVSGWVRTVRTSEATFGFCNINDGSNITGMQIIISKDFMEEEKVIDFLKNIKVGFSIKCTGLLVESPAKGQTIELQLSEYIIYGNVSEGYILSKNRINLDTLRDYSHLRVRTNTFGSVFRIRNKLSMAVHEFYQNLGYLHLDPNVITVNECEGGAGVFQLTEKDISNVSNLKFKDSNYDWTTDHFNKPAYLTVSSQLQLEALACGLGNVYTTNKSFRSEHSNTTKHVSEFTHLEIEMIFNTFEELMKNGIDLVKFCIQKVLSECKDDLENLNNFISKGIVNKLENILSSEDIKITHSDAIDLINLNLDYFVKKDKKNGKMMDKLNKGDDLGSLHETFLTDKFNTCVFVTHWPISIKSFYMKQCNDGTCESFDLLVPGIGELIGASQREDDYDKLVSMMEIKGVSVNDMSFYLDLRKYGTCPHGGFGLGFDRLLMLVTGINNIKDVIPFPVHYKNCSF